MQEGEYGVSRTVSEHFEAGSHVGIEETSMYANDKRSLCSQFDYK